MSSSLVNLTGAHPNKSANFDIFTALIRRMEKVMFSVCPPPWGGGYPSLRFFPMSLVPDSFQGVPQSHVLSKVSGPGPVQGGYPSPRFFPRSLGPGLLGEVTLQVECFVRFSAGEFSCRRIFEKKSKT